MATYTYTDLRSAFRDIARNERKRNTRVKHCVRKVARATKNWIAQETVPKAFGELIDSLYVQDAVNGSAIVADAPHAAAVEVGSRPHTPPLEPLIRWVVLRGMQGLTATGRVRRHREGPMADPEAEDRRWNRLRQTAAARHIAQALRSRMGGAQAAAAWRGVAGGSYGQNDPAVVGLARAIQMAIRKRGTKPSRYMAKGQPQAHVFFARFVPAALRDGEHDNEGIEEDVQ